MSCSPSPPLTGLAAMVERTKSAWGCTIYQTTYSPLSEAHFDKIIGLTTSLIKHNIYRSHDDSNEEERNAYVSLTEFYRPIVMNDKAQFDGMTIHHAREHYQKYFEIPNPGGESDAPVDEEGTRTQVIDIQGTDRRPWTHSNFFILIDKKVV
ncbi:hypothetical protein BJX76DRAFT_354117 [Aspergillus varians]